MRLSGVFLSGIVLLVSSCNLINPADPVPAYLDIQPFTLSVGPGQGTADEKITEAWLYVNNAFLGAYSLPATVPVIAAGESEIILFPGVRVNGIASSPDIYPFYTTYEVTRDLVPAENTVLNPGIGYSDNATFSALEDFEAGHTFLTDLDGDPVTQIVLSNQDVFEGSASGYVELSPEHPELEVSTFLLFTDLPVNGTPVYLELNYKNNVEFAIGLVGVENNPPGIKDYFFIFNQKEEWNKIYIELTERLRVSQFPKYQIAFRAVYNESSGPVNYIYMDNLKLVHF